MIDNRLLIGLTAGLALGLLAVGPAWPQQVTSAPVAAEQELTARIFELANDPPPPGAQTTPLLRDQRRQQIIARRSELIALADKLLERYPHTGQRDRVLQLKMESMFRVATALGQDLAALKRQAEQVLAAGPSPELAEHATFWKLQCDVITKRQQIATDPKLTDEQRTQQFSGFLLGRLDGYVQADPASEFAPAMFARLIQEAESKTDRAAADRYFQQLKKHHPNGMMTQMTTSWLKRRRAVGKPFELSFTSTDGRRIDLKKLRGRVILIDFWASWCMPCRVGVPHLKELYSKYHAKGFELIGVSLDRSRFDMNSYLKTVELPWPIFFDVKAVGDLTAYWGVEQIPTYFVVDKKGLLRSTDARGQLDELIPKLLAE